MIAQDKKEVIKNHEEKWLLQLQNISITWPSINEVKDTHKFFHF